MPRGWAPTPWLSFHVTPNEMELIWVFALIWMLFWCQGIFILSCVLCSSHRHMAQIWRALFAYCSCRRPQAGGHGGRSFWLTQWRRGGRGGRVSRAPEGAAGSKMAARCAWGGREVLLRCVWAGVTLSSRLRCPRVLHAFLRMSGEINVGFLCLFLGEMFAP